MTRAFVVAFVAACSHPSTTATTCGSGTLLVGTTCVAANSPCGPGTHDDDGICVADPPMQPATSYQIRVAPQMGADGSTAYDVFAFGTQPGGSPATDVVVLNIDRAGAGTFVRPQVTLGTRSALSSFVPCANTVPGCTGPLSLTLALAAAPMTPVAHFDTELVDPIDVDPARACLTGGNVFHIEGNDQIFTGATTVTDATWSPVTGPVDRVEVDFTPTDPMQGGPWKLVFSSETFGVSLSPNAYPDAQRWDAVYSLMQPLQAALLVSNNGVTCDTLTGNFTVDTHDVSSSGPSPFTAAFEQHCDGNTAGVIGCIHWEP